MRWILGGLGFAAVVAAAMPAAAQRSADMAPAMARSEAMMERRDAGLIRSGAPEAWIQGDPADSAYKSARLALSNGRFHDASTAFRQLRQRYPKSGYAADAMYWEAFALYREGGTSRLRQAMTVLDQQRSDYPEASTSGDASALAVRVRGELARRGDNASADVIEASAVEASVAPAAAQRNAAMAAREVAMANRDAARSSRAPRAAADGRVPFMRTDSDCGDGDDSDIKIAALNALLQMDAERAVPILKQVLARRDPGSVCLRRKAVFLVSQKQTEGTEDILLDAARNDPDSEVKQQAVFWLSQVGTERATAALDSILRRSTDPELQEKAVFALAQQQSPRATAALRAYAEREDVPEEMREKAVFWLGQSGGAENAGFLRTMYGRTKSAALKQKILFSLSQNGGRENEQFLLDIARNKDENIDARKQAIFWAGQTRSVTSADLAALYATMPDREMKEQLIFVLSQRNDTASMDKMIDIARHDTDPDLRKKALFWVGQSKDPRATQLLQDILNDK